MKILLPEEIAQPIPSVVCVGVFDGVHRGHQRVIGRCVEEGIRLGLSSVVITFDKDPERVLRPEKHVPQLSTPAQKTRFISLLDPGYLVVIPFVERLAALSAEEFLDGYLMTAFEPQVVVVGENFRFGAEAAGDITLLDDYGRSHGFLVEAVPLLEDEGGAVSSTRIRGFLAEGRVDEAAELLGHPFFLAGEVVKGAGRGRELGFHTANVAVDPDLAAPATGVYAGIISLGDEEWPAAINVGNRPTFEPQGPVWVEAHAIGMEEDDIYGRPVELAFLERLRDEKEFGSPAELAVQIKKDVEQTQRVFDRYLGEIG